MIDVILCKGERGFGFTIVGGDDPGEMIQINAIVATGESFFIPQLVRILFYLKWFQINSRH